jgi:alpha-glucosidase
MKPLKLIAMTPSYCAALFLSLICLTSKAQNVPVSRSGMVGNAIAEFIPAGFNSLKTPSLILQKEPSITKPLTSGWNII